MPAGSEHDVAPPPSRRPVQRISGPNRTTPPDARAVPVVPREHHAPIDDHLGASTPAAASAVPRTYAPQSHSSRPHAGSSMPRTTPAPPTGPRVSQRPTSPHSRPSNPSSLSERQGHSAGSARTTRRRPVARIIAVLVLVALVAWPVGLVMWANGKLNRVEALSGAPNTPGDTYLIAGSDSREGTDIGGDAPVPARTLLCCSTPLRTVQRRSFHCRVTSMWQSLGMIPQNQCCVLMGRGTSPCRHSGGAHRTHCGPLR